MMFAWLLRWRDWPLATKLGFLLVALAVPPLAAVALDNSVQTSAELLATARAQNWQRARATTLALDTYLDGLLADIRLVAIAPDTRDLLDNPRAGLTQAEVRVQLRQISQTRGYDALYLTDRNGAVLLASDSRFTGRNYVTARWFLNATAGQTSLDEPRYDAEDGQIYLHFSAPVRDARGLIAGAAVGRIAPAAIDRIIATDTNYSGRGDFGVLWNDLGIRLSHGTRPELRYRPYAPVSSDMARLLVSEGRYGPETSAFLDAATSIPEMVEKSKQLLYDPGADPYLRFEAAGGVPVQAALVPLVNKRWLYGIFTSEAAILATLEAQTRRGLGAAFVVGLLAVLAAVIAARWATRPIRMVADTANAIAAGDMTRRAGLKQRDETGQLAAAFDTMADTLAAKEAQLRQHASELEQGVRERTAELASANAALQADIAERARVEELIRRREQEFHTLAENSPDAVTRFDLQGRYQYVNPARARFFGLSPEDIIGKNWWELLGPEEIEEGKLTDAAFRRTLVEAREQIVEYQAMSPQGVRWVQSRGVPEFDRNGAVESVLVVTRDITELKQAEARLKEQLDELSRWHQATLGREMRILDLKREVNALLAQAGQPPRHPSVETEEVAPLAASARRAGPLPPLAQGEAQRLIEEAGQSRRALLSLLEDQRAAEDEVRRINAELEQRVADRTAQLQDANRELEAFAYSVSHDLRAPLRAMEGFSAALLSSYSGQLDEAGRHYLDRIQSAARRMAQLINDLLNLSRVTRAELTFQFVDLAAIARDIAAELRARDPQRLADFAIAEPLAVEGDPRLLRIAVQNLLENAWKFSGTRPRALIEVGRLSPAEYAAANDDAEAALSSSEQADPPEAIYFIRDNGVGFDMAYAGKLFAPFQRLHAMEEFPGTGIGLAIVRRIISRHGGRVWPRARPGDGAAFFFTLPAAS
jgi:PAS domain S-box-containing protein